MIDTALLWRAWPSGCLAKRGIQTVGRWTCADVDGEGVGTSYWARPSADAYGLRELGLLKDLPDARVSSGHLLPHVDPDDPASWAILLADLADAVNANHPGAEGRPALWPQRGVVFAEKTLRGVYWMLTDSGGSSYIWAFQERSASPIHRGALFPPATMDPVLALVWCRIVEREYAARVP